MLVVAFDTCWTACSVALCRLPAAAESDGEVLASRFEQMKTGQAEALPRMLAEALSEASIAAADIDRIAVPYGPGSFTGVRIGIATARALRLSAAADIAACSSLQLIAIEANRGRAALPQPLLVAMDARNQQAYVQLFENDIFEDQTYPQLLAYKDAASLLTSLSGQETIAVAGTAAEQIVPHLGANGRKVTVLATDPAPNAKWLALNAAALCPLEQALSPIYLRPADAKPQSVTAAIARRDEC